MIFFLLPHTLSCCRRNSLLHAISCMPSSQIYDFRCCVVALSERSFTKSPGEGTLFAWGYSVYRQKQKIVSPYYIGVSVLPWVAVLLESEETDPFSAYFKSTSAFSDVPGRLYCRPELLLLGTQAGTRKFQPVSPTLEGLQLGLDWEITMWASFVSTVITS